ncbi:MAG: hypothetical protein AB7U97_22045 [Pirellulales bacterium]
MPKIPTGQCRTPSLRLISPAEFHRVPPLAAIIARMARWIGSGSVGHAWTSQAKSGDSRRKSAKQSAKARWGQVRSVRFLGSICVGRLTLHVFVPALAAALQCRAAVLRSKSKTKSK